MKNSVKKFSELVNSLEQVSEDQHGMLIGGFAMVTGDASLQSADGSGFNLGCSTNSNCAGGNCVSGCGKVG